jgi:hypothetical protein
MRPVLVVALLSLAAASWSRETEDVTLRFVDCQTGAPVVGAAVRIHNAVEGFPPHPPESTEYLEFGTTTGQDGTATFPDVPTGAWSVGIDHLTGRHVVVADAMLHTGVPWPEAFPEVRTVLNGTLRVSVRYADTNDPVPGARVRVAGARWNTPDPPPWRSNLDDTWAHWLHTDGAGLMESPCWPGLYTVWVEPLGVLPTEPVEATVEPAGICDLPPILLGRKATLPRAIGRVYDGGANGVEGALVNVRKVNPFRLEDPAFTWCAHGNDLPVGCRTSKGGFYDIRDFRYQIWKLGGLSVADLESPVGIAVIAPGYAINWADIPEPRIGDPPIVMDFVLERPGAVSVEFTDADTGRPLTGDDWAIDLYWPGRERGRGPLRWLLKKDETGEVRLNQGPPGECEWELLHVTRRDRRGRPTQWDKAAEGIISIPPPRPGETRPVAIRARVRVPQPP